MNELECMNACVAYRDADDDVSAVKNKAELRRTAVRSGTAAPQHENNITLPSFWTFPHITLMYIYLYIYEDEEKRKGKNKQTK